MRQVLDVRPPTVDEYLPNLPMSRFIKSAKRRLAGTVPVAESQDGWPGLGQQQRYEDEAVLTSVIERPFATSVWRKPLPVSSAREFGVQPVFVWQPAPTYRFAAGDFEEHDYSRYGYPLMARTLAERPPGANFFWCADMHENAKEGLYVDKVHYSAKFSRELASAICGLLIERRLLSPRSCARRAAATTRGQ
jgi:hypothetical protein